MCATARGAAARVPCRDEDGRVGARGIARGRGRAAGRPGGDFTAAAAAPSGESPGPRIRVGGDAARRERHLDLGARPRVGRPHHHPRSDPRRDDHRERRRRRRGHLHRERRAFGPARRRAARRVLDHRAVVRDLHHRSGRRAGRHLDLAICARAAGAHAGHRADRELQLPVVLGPAARFGLFDEHLESLEVQVRILRRQLLGDAMRDAGRAALVRAANRLPHDRADLQDVLPFVRLDERWLIRSLQMRGMAFRRDSHDLGLGGGGIRPRRARAHRPRSCDAPMLSELLTEPAPRSILTTCHRSLLFQNITHARPLRILIVPLVVAGKMDAGQAVLAEVSHAWNGACPCPDEGKCANPSVGDVVLDLDLRAGWRSLGGSCATGPCPLSTRCLMNTSTLEAWLKPHAARCRRRRHLRGRMCCRPPPAQRHVSSWPR